MIIDDIKALLDIDIADVSKDSILNIYIKRAITLIKNYLNNPTYTVDYIQANFNDAIIELVVNAYNVKKNTKDGIKQEQQGSRNVVYKDNNTAFVIDDSIKNLLPLPYAKLM